MTPHDKPTERVHARDLRPGDMARIPWSSTIIGGMKVSLGKFALVTEVAPYGGAAVSVPVRDGAFVVKTIFNDSGAILDHDELIEREVR